MSSMAKNLGTADCVVFGVLTISGYVVGLYFTIGHRRRLKQEASTHGGSGKLLDAFLGGRSLPTAALAFSVLASVANGMSVVIFLGHFYAYGFHILWAFVSTPIVSALTATTLAPVLYEQQMASVFQYLRLRFDNKVGITACVVYFVLSQTLGALGIYSAAIGISTRTPPKSFASEADETADKATCSAPWDEGGTRLLLTLCFSTPTKSAH